MDGQPAGSKKTDRKRGSTDDLLFSMYEALEDLDSILETLDDLGITTREQLVEQIEALDAEITALEIAGGN